MRMRRLRSIKRRKPRSRRSLDRRLAGWRNTLRLFDRELQTNPPHHRKLFLFHQIQKLGLRLVATTAGKPVPVTQVPYVPPRVIEDRDGTARPLFL